LENRARGKYDALDRMSSELRRLQEQRDALDALVETLRTEDGWLAYRVEALRDQLLELEGRPTEGASTVEAVRTTLVDRDEALRRARQDLAGAHAVAAEWEAEVVSTRAQLQWDRAALEGARAWQSQAEERAKEAEEVRASLVDKAAAVARRRSNSGRSESHARRRMASFSRSGPLSPRPGLHLSGSAWCRRRRWVNASKSAPRSRGRRRPSSSGRMRPRSTTGSWSSSPSRTRTYASPSRSRRPQFMTCGERPRRRAKPSRWRRSRSKVG
jgi:hypothetical protein